MKEYPCPKSLTKMCQYGGNKRYNSGFMSGTSSYCRKDKKWVHDLKFCPIFKDMEFKNEEDEMIKRHC